MELTNEVNLVLADARQWLDAHADEVEGSAIWYGVNNLRKFVDELEADHSIVGMNRACKALGWHLADQYVAYEELPNIAAFNDRIRRVAKELEWEEHKVSPAYRPLTAKAEE